jgi:beta-mannanase
MYVQHKTSLHDAMQKLCLHSWNKSQNEEINKLKESNEELSGSNRMMSNIIDTLEKEHFGFSQYLGGNMLIYCLHFH